MNITEKDVGRRVILRNGETDVIHSFNDTLVYSQFCFRLGSEKWVTKNGMWDVDLIPTEYDVIAFADDPGRLPITPDESQDPAGEKGDNTEHQVQWVANYPLSDKTCQAMYGDNQAKATRFAELEKELADKDAEVEKYRKRLIQSLELQKNLIPLINDK